MAYTNVYTTSLEPVNTNSTPSQINTFLCIRIHLTTICPHSTQTTNPTHRHELINVRIREDLKISCPNRDALRLCYDTGTIEKSYEYSWDSARIAQILSRIHYDLQESITNTARTSWISYESVKNMPNASTNQVLLKLNSWLFLTIQRIFPQDRYEKALTCFGVYSWDSWQIRGQATNSRIPEWVKNTYECLRIYYDSVMMHKNALRIGYELTTIFGIGSLWPKFWTAQNLSRIDYE